MTILKNLKQRFINPNRLVKYLRNAIDFENKSKKILIAI